MFPRSSGEYNFLSRAFHPAFGFWPAGCRRRLVSQPGGAGRDGVRRIWQVGAAGRPAAGACHWRRLAGLDRATDRRQAFQHLSIDPTILKVVLITGFLIADLSSARRNRSRRAVCSRLWLCHQRAVRDRAGIRDVFVLGVECRDLYHREMRTPQQTCRARCWRDADRPCALCLPERPCFSTPRRRQAVRPARCRPHRGSYIFGEIAAASSVQ